MTERPSRLRRDAAVTLAAALLIVLWELSAADLPAIRWFGSAGGFAWRDAWLTSTLLHEGGRAAAWAVLCFLAFDAVRPIVFGPPRAARLRWLATALASALLVPAIKRMSHTSCPWDLAEFGGVAAYVPHWTLGITDGGPGHCFPSGHATAAFAFFSGHFLLRDHRPVLARAWLVAVLAAGALFGWAQLARGAHYPSHTLWSAWLCWTICAVAANVSTPGPVQTRCESTPDLGRL